MRAVAIIPARYGSSRLQGKPLMEICGRPMLWWVYQQVKKSEKIQEVWVATDSPEIQRMCRERHMLCRMTPADCPTSTQRLWEAAQTIPADVYVCVNGDEPLIDPQVVEQVLPQRLEGFFAANLMAPIRSPAEAVDESNIKVVADRRGNALYFSRSPIPHPKGSLDFLYYKHLGVLAYTKEALEFFAHTPKGPLEQVEDVNELRFVEHGKPLRMIPVESRSLSVDTEKDLAHVRRLVEEKLRQGKLVIT